MADPLLTPELLDLVADRFKALAEPARLRILNALRAGEMAGAEIMAATGLGQANVSKHLQILAAHGFVARRKAGLYTLYRLADDDVFRLCDLMCGRLAREAEARAQILPGR
jgi:DNA-binding transcriptional ArsR family regulator